MGIEGRLNRLEKIADAAIGAEAANAKRLDLLDAIVLADISIPDEGWGDMSEAEADAFVDALWTSQYGSGFRPPFPDEGDADGGGEAVPVFDDGSVPGRIERIQRVFRSQYLPPAAQ